MRAGHSKTFYCSNVLLVRFHDTHAMKGGELLFRFLFGGGNKNNEQKQADQTRAQLTVDALTRGNLPPYVVDRIHKESTGQLPWTSDLSINEWALLQRYRVEPLGQVMGSSVYHVGFVYRFGDLVTTRELKEPTNALYEGRKLALSRLRQEAALLGANAVVGVKLVHKGFDFEAQMVEYACFGTAVRLANLPASQNPVLCTVSGQDFVRLLAADALPVGLALGASFYYVHTDFWSQRQRNSWVNQEMSQFQRAVSEVRHLTMSRMRWDVRTENGTGVIGAGFDLHVEERSGGKTNDDEEIVDYLLDAVTIGTIIDHSRSQQAIGIKAVLNLSK